MPTDRNNRFYKRTMNQWVFNQAIYDTREEHGFSQEEMGRLLKVSGRTINAYEMKKIKPSVDVIVEFLKVFNYKIFIVDKHDDVTEFDFIENTTSHFKS